MAVVVPWWCRQGVVAMVSVLKFRNMVPVVPVDDAERRVRDRAVWFVFGRETANVDILPRGGAAFLFADAYLTAWREYRRGERGIQPAMTHAFVEWMMTGTV